MTDLAQRIGDAKAEVARLEREAAAATCAEMGQHAWRSLGGANCGCLGGTCSVPVNECARCGDCDYGFNEDARQVRRDCKEGA